MTDRHAWTDDELDMLDIIGTNLITVAPEETSDRSDADVTEWSTAVDILDLEDLISFIEE